VNEPVTAHQGRPESVDDTSTHHQILAATLSDVALTAGVSRPTIYRWFPSREQLLEAFGIYEREMFDNGTGHRKFARIGKA
jgi:hypothetical protein